MVSWLLLILMLIAFIVLGTWAWGVLFGRGEVLEPVRDRAALEEANRAAVADGRVDDLRFELVPRGYRPEQVDAVIAEFTEQLAQARRLSEKND